MRIVLFIAVCLLYALQHTSCGPKKEQQDAGYGERVQLPTVPDQLMVDLWERCDYVDIIFMNSPASMSQNDINSIRGSLNYISREPAVRNPSCSPVARVAYMAGGELMADANVYCSEGCLYMEFMDNNKPVYVNHLSRSGVQFYNDILIKLQPPQ